jgi:hypothetical protein
MHSVNDYLNSPITDSIPLLTWVLKKNHAWLITNKDYTFGIFSYDIRQKRKIIAN